MVEVARSQNLQLLHVHYAIPFAPAAILAKQMAPELDLRLITTLHGTDTSLVGAAPSFRPVTRFAIEQSDAVTTVSEALRAETIETFAVEREIDVIPNCIDPEHYAPDPGTPLAPAPAAARPLTMLHISNFRPVKRVDRVIDGFAAVRARVERSLRDLRTPYLDAVCVHWPVPGKHVAAYRALDAARRDGLLLLRIGEGLGPGPARSGLGGLPHHRRDHGVRARSAGDRCPDHRLLLPARGRHGAALGSAEPGLL